MTNHYIPQLSTIKEVIKHTDLEYTFRMTFEGEVKPGQFFEISIPKYGEAPISVSGIGDGLVDFTIRRVGKVTNEIFENYVGDKLFIRGPYGNGFDVENYKGRELVVVAGGTGLSPVRGVVNYFADHNEEVKSMTLIAGFKSPKDVLFKGDFEYWKEKMNVIKTVDTAPEGYDGPVGMVTKYIPELKFEDIRNTAFICVGPPIMIKFTLAEILKLGVPEENIWISHERKMCCGIGKCGHCKIGSTYVCLDGPVFNYVEGKNLIDQEVRKMGLDINTKKLKKNAFRVTKERGIGASRIRVPGGYLNAEVLSTIQEIAQEYGNGFIHLTTRQGIEIEGIRFEDMDEINEKLQPIIDTLEINQDEPLKGYPASGTRNISACIGNNVCPFANFNTAKFAKRIEKEVDYYCLDAPIMSIAYYLSKELPDFCRWDYKLTDYIIFDKFELSNVNDKTKFLREANEELKELAIKFKTIINYMTYSIRNEKIEICFDNQKSEEKFEEMLIEIADTFVDRDVRRYDILDIIEQDNYIGLKKIYTIDAADANTIINKMD